MNTAAKISTCSYCGTRVVFTLSGNARHELICTSCGAPLKNTTLIHRSPVSTAQTLFDVPKLKPDEQYKDKEKQEAKKHSKRRDSEEYKKYRKYRSRDSEKKEWRKEDDDLWKKYKERKYHKRKKPTKKRRGLFYWIREAADEIDDIFD